MEISITPTPHGIMVLQLSGRIDTSTATLLKRRIDTLINAGTARLVIDLSAVSFVDSLGLACWLAASGTPKSAAVICGWPTSRPRCIG